MQVEQVTMGLTRPGLDEDPIDDVRATFTHAPFTIWVTMDCANKLPARRPIFAETLNKETVMHAFRLFWFLVVASLITGLPASAAEQKKVTWSTTYGPVLQRSEVKVAGHVLSLQTRQDLTSSADADWDGAVFVVNSQADLVEGSGPVRGCVTCTHKNGDQSYICYEGTLKRTGDDVAAQGSVELRGGTGKFANLKGKGTFASTAKGSSVTAEVEY
jgi:hypothetical protein